MRVIGINEGGAMARFDFLCPHCKRKRSFYMTPPHPDVKLPRLYTHNCPDCGGELRYSVDYDASGILFVEIG